MMRFLRKHRGWLMTVIAILTVPFCLYFVKTDRAAMRSDEFARVYDRKISMTEARKYARLLDLGRSLGLPELGTSLTMGAKDQNELYADFILNLLVLRHEAEKLGIRPSDAEVIQVVHNLPSFGGPGAFDLKKYDDFVQNALSPNGMGEAQIEEVVRDDITFKRIRELVGTGVSVPESVSKANFDEAYGRMQVSVIRLKSADVGKDIKITDDDIQKYFESHKNEYKTDEKRKIDFVELALTEEQKKLTGKERIEPLQKLADRANDFSQALLEKGADFKAVAAKFQLPVKTTGEFTANAPDPLLKDAPTVPGIAFKLTPQDPNSDPIQTPNGFYLVHLAGTVEARPLSLEEAKPKVVDALKRARSRELLSTKGSEIVHKIRDEMKPGATLEAAIQKAGVKAEKVPPFSLMEEPKADAAVKDESKKEPPDYLAIKNAASRLEPGEVSEFMPWEDGGVIAILEKREAPDAAATAQSKVTFDTQSLTNKREIVFYEWLRDKQTEAGLFAPQPAQNGPPPAKKS